MSFRETEKVGGHFKIPSCRQHLSLSSSMAVLQHSRSSSSKPKTSSTSNCFLGFFGFSKKKMQLSDEMKGKPSHRRIRWRFHLTKSGSKTVPVDTTVSGKPDRSGEVISFKSDNYMKVSSSKVPTQAEIQEVEPDPIHVICEEEKYEDVQHLILLDDKQPKKEVTSKSSLRKAAAVLTESKSAIVPFSPSAFSPSLMLSHSSSLPPPKQKKTTTTMKTANNNNSNTSRDENSEEGSFGGKFDPVVGMSIILVTTFIMLVWGKLCAILCTSAWFFLVPHLRPVINGPQLVTPEKDDLNLNSQEYKKKVVLQGLLQRNHRNAK